jgi:flagellar motor switch protein FliG
MSNGRDIVITAYGHDKNIDKIAVVTFDSDNNHYRYGNDSNAKAYCDAINDLELNENSWIFAQIVPENAPFSLDSFVPLEFDIILKMDNLAIQKVLRELDAREIARALKDTSETVKEKIFSNMSKNAAQTLKEDIESLGPIRINVVKEYQRKIVAIIHHLEQVGDLQIR